MVSDPSRQVARHSNFKSEQKTEMILKYSREIKYCIAN